MEAWSLPSLNKALKPGSQLQDIWREKVEETSKERLTPSFRVSEISLLGKLREVGQLHKKCSYSLSSFLYNSSLLFFSLSDIAQCTIPQERNPSYSTTKVLGKTHLYSLTFSRHGSPGQNFRGRWRAKKL